MDTGCICVGVYLSAIANVRIESGGIICAYVGHVREGVDQVTRH